MLYIEGAPGLSDHWQAAARMAINMHNTISTFHKSLQANAHIILIQHRINSVRVNVCVCVWQLWPITWAKFMSKCEPTPEPKGRGACSNVDVFAIIISLDVPREGIPLPSHGPSN